MMIASSAQRIETHDARRYLKRSLANGECGWSALMARHYAPQYKTGRFPMDWE